MVGLEIAGRRGVRMSDELIVFVTVPSREDGERIAETLVGEQLAACVNVVGPIRSIYRWQGEICRDDEHLLLIKTTRARYAALEARVRSCTRTTCRKSSRCRSRSDRRRIWNGCER